MTIDKSRIIFIIRHSQIVDLHSNRGAYVASPTPEQAREVFEARRSIEPNVARLAVERAKKADIADLKRHLAEESAAQKRGDRRQTIGLSGQFHVKLAQVAGMTGKAAAAVHDFFRNDLGGSDVQPS